MTSDTSEKGFESLIIAGLVEQGWVGTSSSGYDRNWTVVQRNSTDSSRQRKNH